MKQVTKAVLVFIVVLHSITMFTGCADRPPARMAWVSIEKPPIRLIYVNQQELIGDETVHHLLQHIERQPYKDYKFNEAIGISATAAFHQSDVESDTDTSSSSITVSK